MKKSKMERAMRIKFMGYLAQGYGLEEIMNKILDKQIEMGMLPPVRGNKGAFHTIRDEIDCTWEPEDD